MTTSTSPLYNLDRCNFFYGQFQALKNITASFEKGQFYGIIGPNGSGKTTLLDLLLHHSQPQSGTLTFKNQPFTNYTSHGLAREIAMVPQEFQLGFDYSVYQVVMMGRHPHIPRFSSPGDEDHQIVEENLKLLNIWEYRNRPAKMLSGGEKQRVVAARALSQNCPVMLLDEATSNLDIQHTIDIMKIIHSRVTWDRVTVIATIHDLNLAGAFCDQLIALKDGEIYSKGKTEQVLTEACIKELFNVSARISSHNNHISIQYAYT